MGSKTIPPGATCAAPKKNCRPPVRLDITNQQPLPVTCRLAEAFESTAFCIPAGLTQGQNSTPGTPQALPKSCGGCPPGRRNPRKTDLVSRQPSPKSFGRSARRHTSEARWLGPCGTLQKALAAVRQRGGADRCLRLAVPIGLPPRILVPFSGEVAAPTGLSPPRALTLPVLSALTPPVPPSPP